MTEQPSIHADLMDAAISYAARGWYVFPLQPQGKVPHAGTSGFKDATNDVETVRALWTRYAGSNIGVRCGPESGLFVVDIDPRHGGDVSIEHLAEANGGIPPTLVCITQSGGRHLYFRYEEGLRNSAGSIAAGIDTRGIGGYVVVPPSIGPTGAIYEWEDGEGPEVRDPATLPAWLKPRQANIPSAGPFFFKPKADGSPVREGGRNEAAASLAGTFFRNGASLAETTSKLLEWNKTNVPPLPDREVVTTVVSIAKTHTEKNPAFPIPILPTEDPPLVEVMEDDDEPEAVVEFPPHLLSPPGIVGEICNYINDSAIKPQPIYALGNALAFWGAIVGRKVSTPTDLRTNLYILGVGPSGSGKDHSRKCIKKIASAAGVMQTHMGGEEVSSDSAIMAAAYKNPSLLFQFDEVGHLLGRINSRAADAHVKAIAPTLTKLYSSSNTLMLGKQYAGTGDDRPRNDIDQPNVCLYGTTVPEKLYGGLTPDEVRDGFLGRLLVFCVNDNDPEERDAKPLPVPRPITELVAYWANRTDLPKAEGNLAAAMTNIPFVVPLEADAEAMMNDFKRRCRVLKEEHRDGSGLDALWARGWENALKVALTVSCGVHGGEPIISRSVASWSIELVEHVTSYLVAAVRDSVSATEYGRDELKVMRAIKRAGKKGLTVAGVGGQTRGMHPTLRSTILNDLVAKKSVAIGSRDGLMVYVAMKGVAE